MPGTPMKKRFGKEYPFLKLSVSIVVIVLAAILLSVSYRRFDLTSEKRYTLSGFTKTTLRNLDEDI
jgi:ABC-type uncharacterized transport system involved in gliding motility auxiliary subunit